MSTPDDIIEKLVDPRGHIGTGAGAALAGSMAAWMIATASRTGLDRCRSARAEEELRRLDRQALSLRRDLIALAFQSTDAEKEFVTHPAPEGSIDERRIRSLLFAAEVPLKTAESCQVLLNISMRVLGRAGVKAIAEIGSAAAMAYGGVLGAVLTARSTLALTPGEASEAVDPARKRAELILRDAEALRSQIVDRVRRHLP